MKKTVISTLVFLSVSLLVLMASIAEAKTSSFGKGSFSSGSKSSAVKLGGFSSRGSQTPLNKKGSSNVIGDAATRGAQKQAAISTWDNRKKSAAIIGAGAGSYAASKSYESQSGADSAAHQYSPPVTSGSSSSSTDHSLMWYLLGSANHDSGHHDSHSNDIQQSKASDMTASTLSSEYPENESYKTLMLGVFISIFLILLAAYILKRMSVSQAIPKASEVKKYSLE